jgi:two-component system, OmpR family, phosphate regulon sensor histidine kinase PhoR
MRSRLILRVVSGVAAVLVFFTSVLLSTFFLTHYVFQHLGHEPSAVLVQVINSLLGLLLGVLILAGLSHTLKSKRWAQQMRGFRPIIDAMERIAQGDFNIRLDNQFQDIEPFGELVTSVNNMALELNEMEQLRQEFISNVSHEIQSPLTSIRGFAEALRDSRLSPDDRNHYLSIIEAESTRLGRITDNLLRLASLESKHVRFEPKPYRLDRQIRDLILACEPQWSDKGTDMDVSLDEVEITADEDLLSQVWVNLIHNSIKFTPPGGRVCVDLHLRGGKIEFKISDTGIGIPAEDQVCVFERFYKADKSRTHSNGGSGLGLSIAKKIVDLHNGTIAVESKLGAGATFAVSLPSSPERTPKNP